MYAKRVANRRRTFEFQISRPPEMAHPGSAIFNFLLNGVVRGGCEPRASLDGNRWRKMRGASKREHDRGCLVSVWSESFARGAQTKARESEKRAATRAK